MPRFNLSWLYVIIAMSFAILYFSNQEGGIDKQITYTEFKDMINKGYANKVIANYQLREETRLLRCIILEYCSILTIDRNLDVCHAPHERWSRNWRRQSVQCR